MRVHSFRGLVRAAVYAAFLLHLIGATETTAKSAKLTRSKERGNDENDASTQRAGEISTCVQEYSLYHDPVDAEMVNFGLDAEQLVFTDVSVCAFPGFTSSVA